MDFSKKMNEYMLEKPVHLLLTWVLGDASCTVLQDVFWWIVQRATLEALTSPVLSSPSFLENICLRGCPGSQLQRVGPSATAPEPLAAAGGT